MSKKDSNFPTMFPYLFIYLLVGLGLNSGLYTCKAGAIPLEPHRQSLPTLPSLHPLLLLSERGCLAVGFFCLFPPSLLRLLGEQGWAVCSLSPHGLGHSRCLALLHDQ
jgi:hypothetical protein